MYDKLLLEAFVIGVYCMLLYMCLHPVNILVWFLFGFVKHFVAYYIGIHDYYCQHGYCPSCYNKSKSIGTYIVFDSILEGFLFILVGLIVNIFTKYRYIAMFVMGFSVHIFAEIFQIHSYFCKHRCI